MKKLGIVLGVVVLFGVFGSCILLFSDSKKDENPTTIKEETSIKAEDTVESAKLTLVGDLLFETRFYEAVENGDDPNLYFQLVQDYFSDDDLLTFTKNAINASFIPENVKDNILKKAKL